MHNLRGLTIGMFIGMVAMCFACIASAAGVNSPEDVIRIFVAICVIGYGILIYLVFKK